MDKTFAELLAALNKAKRNVELAKCEETTANMELIKYLADHDMLYHLAIKPGVLNRLAE